MIALAAFGRERIAASTLAAGALLFVATGIPRVFAASGFGALSLLLVLLATDLLIAAALFTAWYPIRSAAQALAIFGMLAHTLVLLHSGPLWTRVCSAVLVCVHGWALVLLFLLTATENRDFDQPELDPAAQLGGEDSAVELASPTHEAQGPEESSKPEESPSLETPVSAVVELAVARHQEEQI
ncbi:MAG: hypothetical protein JO100_14575 [Pseudonocardia sp.]|nr:hypothetical protein [Pseudonocardia sp.]